MTEEPSFNGSCYARSGHYPAKNSGRTRSDRSCEAICRRQGGTGSRGTPARSHDPRGIAARRYRAGERGAATRSGAGDLQHQGSDHGGLLHIAGLARKAVQYEIGNPLTAARMTQHRLSAALYAPLRVVLYEDEAGRAAFEYDRPSSLFDQFGDERVTAVA